VQELGNLFLSVTGGAVYYVGAAAAVAQLGDVGQGITGRTFTSVNSALLQCVSGRGDVIYVLPGYTESIAGADAWSNLSQNDVTIIGMGRGTNRPTFTWTAAASSVLFDTANFRLLNCKEGLAGANAAGAALTVAAPITVSAAGCEISNCTIFYGFDADQIVTIGITTEATADFFKFNRNYCYSATAAECTSFLYAVGADFMQMHDTTIIGGTSSTAVGVLRFITTASVGIDIQRCVFQNLKASSIHCVTQMAGVLGVVKDCLFGILDNATKAGWVPAGAGDGPQFGNCFTANLAGENGTATTPIST
jgi:hypothetical protein